MKLIKLARFILLTIGVLSCKSELKNAPLIKESKPEIEIKKVVEKEWDSLSPSNVVPFFTEYGKQNKETVVLLQTKYGNIKLKLFNDTPIHRANFIFLTKIGYFDTTVFYRVAPDFVIQGGNSDNLSTLKLRRKYKDYQLPSEFRPNRPHVYGSLAAARDWDNNPSKKSTPFEFYIVQSRNGAPHIDNEHTVFGQVLSGFSAIDKIVNLKAGPDEWPKENVYIKVDVLN